MFVSELERTNFKFKTDKDVDAYVELREIFLSAWEQNCCSNLNIQDCKIPAEFSLCAVQVFEFLCRYGFINYGIDDIPLKPSVDKKHLDVVIVGGGFSAITCAKKLRDFGHNVTILEKTNRIGGRVYTIQTPSGHFVDLGESGFPEIEASRGYASLINPLLCRVKQLGADFKLFNKKLLFDKHGKIPEEILLKARNFWAYIYNKFDGIKDLDVGQLKEELQEIYPEEARNIRTSSHRSILNELTVENGIDIIKAHMEAYRKMSNARESSVSDFLRRMKERVEGDFDEISFPQWENQHKYQHVCTSSKGMGCIVDDIEKKGVLVKKNQVVKCVEHHGGIALVHSENETFKADVVIVATSLTALQSEQIEFRPTLPRQKSTSLSSFGRNIVHRVALEFEKPFWDPSSDTPGINRATTQQIGKCLRFSYIGDENFPIEFENLWAIRKAPILTAVISGGDLVEIYEGYSEEELKQKLMKILRHLFGSVPDPIFMAHTKKEDEPSFPIIGPGSSKDHVKRLGQNVGNQLFFCGSGTDVESFGTLNGSYRSAMRTAGEIHNLVKPLVQKQFERPKSAEKPNPFVANLTTINTRSSSFTFPSSSTQNRRRIPDLEPNKRRQRRRKRKRVENQAEKISSKKKDKPEAISWGMLQKVSRLLQETSINAVLGENPSNDNGDQNQNNLLFNLKQMQNKSSNIISPTFTGTPPVPQDLLRPVAQLQSQPPKSKHPHHHASSSILARNMASPSRKNMASPIRKIMHSPIRKKRKLQIPLSQQKKKPLPMPSLEIDPEFVKEKQSDKSGGEENEGIDSTLSISPQSSAVEESASNISFSTCLQPTTTSSMCDEKSTSEEKEQKILTSIPTNSTETEPINENNINRHKSKFKQSLKRPKSSDKTIMTIPQINLPPPSLTCISPSKKSSIINKKLSIKNNTLLTPSSSSLSSPIKKTSTISSSTTSTQQHTTTNSSSSTSTSSSSSAKLNDDDDSSSQSNNNSNSNSQNTSFPSSVTVNININNNIQETFNTTTTTTTTTTTNNTTTTTNINSTNSPRINVNNFSPTSSKPSFQPFREKTNKNKTRINPLSYLANLNATATTTSSKQTISQIILNSKRKLISENPATLHKPKRKKTEKKKKKSLPEGYFYVENILNHKDKNGTTYYLIKWRGYEETTWEPKKNLPSHLVENYRRNITLEIKKKQTVKRKKNKTSPTTTIATLVCTDIARTVRTPLGVHQAPPQKERPYWLGSSDEED